MHHCSIEEDENEIGVVGMDDVSTNMTTIPRCHHKNGRHTGNGKMTMPRDKQKFGSGRHGYVDYCGNLVEPFDTNTVVNPKRERPSFLLTTSMSQSTFSSNSPPPTPPTKLQNWLRKWTRRKNSESSNDDCSLPSSSVSLSTSSTPSSSALHRKCHSSNLTMSGVNNNATRRIVLKAFQITSVLICLVCLYTLVDNVLYLAKSYNHNNNNNSESSSSQQSSAAYSAGSSMMSANNNLSSFAIYDQLQSWIVNQDHFTNSLSTFATNNGSIKSKSLLQIKNFRFVLNNASICAPDLSHRRRSSSSSSIAQHDKIFFMILVHSAPDHFEERQAIRSTWGSVKTLKNWGIRLIFLLGKDSDPDSEFVERSIVRESEIFGDIVSGNFIDSYRNLTYKHLMGYKWALNYCPGANFILKTDDDSFIDIFQLFDFTTRTYGYRARETLVCNVYPEGMKPVRVSDKIGLKWKVSVEEYPHSLYPKYCGGLAYLASPDVVRKVFSASEHVKFFWIDDVYVTGVLRELVQVDPFYLNLRYSYEPLEYRKWLEDRQPQHRFRKIPFMIVHVERGLKYSEEMNDLWRKTLQVWS